MHNRNHVTIGLLWHSLGSGNLGVGALTESNIAIVRDAAEQLGLTVTFLILGTSEKGIPELEKELVQAGHSIECHRIRIFRQPFRSLVQRCDFVLDIGEGDSFADIYGFKRFFYHWVAKNIVCLFNKKLVLSPQTIGPFNGTAARLMAKQIMKRCFRVFSRDHLSSSYLSSIGIRGNISEAIDVAFCLPFTKAIDNSETIRVGINVSGLLFNGGYTGNNQFGLTVDYPQLIRKLVQTFTQTPGVEVFLIGHVLEPNMPVEDDLHSCELLAKEYPSVTVAPAFSRPSDAKSYISTMDFFLGARMHACIAAYSSGVPVIPMAYSRKFNGLFGSLNYTAIADCKAHTDAEILAIVQNGFAQREQLADQIRQSEALILNKLDVYRSTIREILKGVSKRA